MKKYSTHLVRMVVLFACAYPALAADQYTMRQPVFQELSAAQALVDSTGGKSANPLAALNKLQSMLQTMQLTSYEKAQVHNMAAYSHYLLEDNEATIAAYNRVLAEDAPPALRRSTLFTLAQLATVIEDYENGLRYLDEFESAGGEVSQRNVKLRIQILYQLKRYQEALNLYPSLTSLVRGDGRVMEEAMLKLQQFMAVELEDFGQAMAAAESLVTLYPNDDQWRQLANLYSVAGQPEKSAFAFYAAYQQGTLEKETEIIELAQLLLTLDLGWEAVVVMQDSIKKNRLAEDEKTLNLLAIAYSDYEDYKAAADAWRRKANLTDSGGDWMRLGGSLMALQDYQAALEAYRQARKKETLSESELATVSMMEAIANASLKQWQPARQLFRSLEGHANHGEAALEWLSYIDKEEERIAAAMRSFREGKVPEINRGS